MYILREGLAGLLQHGSLEALHQLLQVLHFQLGILGDALSLLHRTDLQLEGVDVVLILGLQSQYHIAVHLYEAAVRVPCEARVIGQLGKSLDSLIIETKIEDGVHHTRHGGRSTGADRDEERISRVAKGTSHECLDLTDICLYVLSERLADILCALGLIGSADLCRDCKSGRHRYAYEVHLGEVGSLTTEEHAHVCATLGLAVAKGVNLLTAFAHTICFF